MRRKGVTIDDVARQAGVSPATVSRCLNKPDLVRPALKARVDEAVRALDYVPHGAARSLASRRSRMIGAVFPSLDSALFGGALEALQTEISDSGYSLVVASSAYDPARELAHIQNLLASGVDALMLVGGARTAEAYRPIQRMNVPYVLIWVSRATGGHPCIGFDNEAAGAAVARHLLDMGHRRFAMISGRQDGNDRASARIAGVRSALGQHGLELAEQDIVETPFGVDEGRDAMRSLMTRRRRPTAIVCGAEPFAYGAILECPELGLTVPRDISITGFDDMSLSASMAPGLTTVRTPRHEMGRLAGRYLFSVLNGNAALPTRPLEFELIVRGSTGPPPDDGAS